MKTIYNTYVVMESQEQCDRMKQLCLDNGLIIELKIDDFKYMRTKNLIYTFRFSDYHNVWGVFWEDKQMIKVTEEEFKELLKTK